MVIADSGFWLALANRRDEAHDAAKAAYAALREPLVTTWPVVAETCHLLRVRMGVAEQVTFIKGYAQGAFEVFDLDRSHASRLQALMERYADLPMDLADASLVIVAEHLGHGRILSTDQRDFRAYRWKDRQPFQNLLADP
jgi:hypothetical protein